MNPKYVKIAAAVGGVGLVGLLWYKHQQTVAAEQAQASQAAQNTSLYSTSSYPVSSGTGTTDYSSGYYGGGDSTGLSGDTSSETATTSSAADTQSYAQQLAAIVSALGNQQAVSSNNASSASSVSQTVQQASLVGQPLSIDEGGIIVANPNLYGTNQAYTSAWNTVYQQNVQANGSDWQQVQAGPHTTEAQQAQLNMSSLDRQISGNIPGYNTSNYTG